MTVYEIITERMLALMEKGTVPWHRPWDSRQGIPRNLVTNRPYRGVNVFLLFTVNYANPYWLTYRQALTLGGHVKGGEKGMPIIFWKLAESEESPERDSETSSGKGRPILRYYTVFNLQQTEGIPAPPVQEKVSQFSPIEACEQIVSGMPNRPEISHGHSRALYRFRLDRIEMPDRQSFHSPEEYYGTLFHELGHSTGHERRLARKTLIDASPSGETNYSREELVAEMTATFLCGIAGIANWTIDNSAAYLTGWQQKLKSDPRAIVIAAAQAQKAADYILSASPADKSASTETSAETQAA